MNLALDFSLGQNWDKEGGKQQVVFTDYVAFYFYETVLDGMGKASITSCNSA